MISAIFGIMWFFADGDGCEWLITAPEGNVISLEFDHYEVGIKMNLSIREILI